MTVDEALKAAEKIPSDAKPDWEGTNHFEISTVLDKDGGYFWLVLSDWFPDEIWECPDMLTRIGHVLDAACALPVLAAEVRRLQVDNDALYADLSARTSAATQAAADDLIQGLRGEDAAQEIRGKVGREQENFCPRCLGRGYTEDTNGVPTACPRCGREKNEHEKS